MTEYISRAVPSPPANKIRLAFALTIIATATRVSSAEVSSGIFIGKTAGEKPASCAAFSPIIPGGHITSIDSGNALRISLRHVVARIVDSGFAPNATAEAIIAAVSVPLRPTRPPIPEIGFTIKPSVFLIFFTLKL